MAVYKVIVSFADLQDKNHVYNVGDVFPHDGRVVSPNRLRSLSTNANNRGTPLIAISGNAKEKPVEKKAEDKDEETKYTKSEINRMAVDDLKKVATEVGIEDADDKTGGELKKAIIEQLGL